MRGGAKQKEEVNAIREELMAKALKNIARMVDKDFWERMRDAQRQLDQERRMRELAEGMNYDVIIKSRKAYDLYCIKCDSFMCKSEKMRVIQEMHRVCCDEDFYKCTDLHLEAPQQLDNRKELTRVGLLRCKTCGVLWGVQARYHRTPVPIIQAKCFVAVDRVTKEREVYKKWKDVPFGKEAITEEGMKTVWQSAKKLRNLNDDVAQHCEELELE